MTESSTPVVDPDWTARQRQVLDLLAQGKTNPQIASELDIGLDGAKWHVRIVLEKLGVDSREEAAHYWRVKQSARAKTGSWVRGVLGLNALKWAAGTVGAIVLAGGIAGALYLAWPSDDDSDAAVANDETPQAGATSTPAVAAPDLPLCDFSDIAFTIQDELVGGNTIITVLAAAPEACHAVATLQASIQPADGSLRSNGQEFHGVVDEDADLSVELGRSPVPVATYAWTNWCGDPGFPFIVYVGADSVPEPRPLETLPTCRDINQASTVVLVDDQALPPPLPLPTLDEIDGIPVNVLSMGDPVPLPPNVMLYYSLAGISTDSNPWNVRRAYLAPGGDLIREPLLPFLEASLGEDIAVVANSSFADGLTDFAMICVAGYCGGLAEPSDDAEQLLVASQDGGITWSSLGPQVPGTGIAGIVDGELMLVVPGETNGQFTRAYVTYPSGITVDPPFEDAWLQIVPGSTGTGLLTWRLLDPPPDSRGHHYATDGSLLVEPFVTNGGLILDGATPSGLLARSGDPRGQLIGVLDSGFQPQAFYRWPFDPPGPHFVTLAGAISTTRLIGTMELEDDPTDDRDFRLEVVLVDLETLTIHPIPSISEGIVEDFGDQFPSLVGDGFANLHPFAREVATGPFARINTGDDDCLNIRQQPSTTAEVVACHVDGVLLTHNHQTTDADGITWLEVTTPSGQPGYATTEFLDWAR